MVTSYETAMRHGVGVVGCHVDTPAPTDAPELQSAVSGNNLLVCWEGGSDWRTTPRKTATPRSGQEPEAARAHAECATGACPQQHPSVPVNVDQQPSAGHAASKQDGRLECSFFSRAELKSAGGAALQHRKSRTDQASSRPQPRKFHSAEAPGPSASSSQFLYTRFLSARE